MNKVFIQTTQTKQGNKVVVEYGPGPCFKQEVFARVIAQSGDVFESTNFCMTPQKFCPRDEAGYKSGEGYHLCKSMCQQVAHAEVNAINLAGIQSMNSRLEVYGHTYACDDCKQFAERKGVLSIDIKQIDKNVDS